LIEPESIELVESGTLLLRIGAVTRPELKTNPRVAPRAKSGRPNPSRPRIRNWRKSGALRTYQGPRSGIHLDQGQRPRRHMPQAVLSILQGIHDSNRFPPLPMEASHFQFQVPVSNAMNLEDRRMPGRLVGLLALRPEWIVGHDERNFRVGVQPIEEKEQVMLVNEEAE